MSSTDRKGLLNVAPGPQEPPRKLDLFSDDPGSMRRRLGACDFLDHVELHHTFDPTLFCMDESSLWKWFKEHKMPVTADENMLRYKLWTEYDLSVMEDRQMNLPSIYGGVMTYKAFHHFYTEKREKVAWLMCPPVSYEIANREALGFSTGLMRRYLEVDPMEQDPKTGRSKPNIRLMELQAKIHAMLDMRVHGNFTQRIEQKTLSVNVSGAGKLVQKYTESGSLAALEEELDALSDRERDVLNLPRKEQKRIMAERVAEHERQTAADKAKTIDVTSEPVPAKKTDF